MKFVAGLFDQFNANKVSPYLRAVLFEISDWFERTHKHSLTVTGLLRLPERQVEICKEYKLKSDFQHTVGEAADLRLFDIPPVELKGLLDYAKFNLGKICKLAQHSKGTGAHLHLNLIDGFTDKTKINQTVEDTDGAKQWFTG